MTYGRSVVLSGLSGFLLLKLALNIITLPKIQYILMHCFVIYKWSPTNWWFSVGTSFSFTIKTNHREIVEILSSTLNANIWRRSCATQKEGSFEHIKLAPSPNIHVLLTCLDHAIEENEQSCMNTCAMCIDLSMFRRFSY